MGAMNSQPEKSPLFREEEGVFLPHATLVSMIRGSVGSAQFQKMYFEQNGGAVDVLENGNLSCAIYVSFLLYPLGLIKEPHTFVSHTIRDMEHSGWVKIDEPRPGAVLVWGPWEKSSHHHIGFSLGEDQAVSNVDMTQTPQQHHWTYGEKKDGTPARRVTAIYWHPSFDKELRREM